jgi:beta-glucosidase
VSLLAALRDSRPELEVRHAAGVPINATEAAGIPEALECCDGAQAILLCLGEAAGMSGEAASRADPVLPGRQRLLAESVLQRARAQRTPVIAILFSGRPLIVPWLAQQADALLAAWFPGSEAGHALLDVLSGRIGPVGRTPMSWPRALGQVPIFFGQRQGGRPADPKDFFTSKYLDVPNEPLYPFGHGLSYTRFRCSNLRLGAPTVRIADSLEVQVDVSNEGDCAGEETLFLFMRDPIAAIARPVLELRGWTRIALAAGESSTASLRLAASDLGQLGAAPQRGLEPGEIELLVGPCADRTRLLSISVRLEA